MKKLLVLMLVLGIGSIASAGFVHGIVEYEVVGSQLIGTGTATGIYDAFLSNDGLIVPSPATDSGTPGLMKDAGNLAKVADFGVVYNVHAEHLAAGAGNQAPGVWFVFDIIAQGNIILYNTDESIAGRLPNILVPFVWADTGGPYSIDTGQTVELDSSGSYSDYGIDEFHWRIDGQDVPSSVSYSLLTNDLGLTAGIYDVELRVVDTEFGSDTDYTTIEIIPEPATLLLLGLGGVMVRRRRT